MEPPWMIMMYRSSMEGQEDDTVPVWVRTKVKEWISKGRLKRRLTDRVLTPKQARTLIQQHGLELAVKNEYGEVWHDPKNTVKNYMNH